MGIKWQIAPVRDQIGKAVSLRGSRNINDSYALFPTDNAPDRVIASDINYSAAIANAIAKSRKPALSKVGANRSHECIRGPHDSSLPFPKTYKFCRRGTTNFPVINPWHI